VSEFVSALREQLVDAAEREQARRLPRPQQPSRRLVLGLAVTGAMALIIVLAVGALNPRLVEDAERPAATPTPEGRDLFGGSIEPGVRYRTRAFVPALSFEVTGSHWHVVDTTQQDVLVLDHGEGFFDPDGERRPPGELWFLRVPQVHDPAVRGLRASVAPAPADLYAWMRAHPDLRVGARRPVTVGGVPGDSFAVTVRFRRPTHDLPDCRTRHRVVCTALTPQMAFQDGTLLRVTVLRTEPEPLVIMVQHFTRAGLRQMEEAAAPVLKSLQIGIR
jgi:hypothetical protein